MSEGAQCVGDSIEVSNVPAGDCTPCSRVPGRREIELRNGVRCETHSRGAEASVSKAVQKACNQIASVKAKDINPMTTDATLMGASVGILAVAQWVPGHQCAGCRRRGMYGFEEKVNNILRLDIYFLAGG